MINIKKSKVDFDKSAVENFKKQNGFKFPKDYIEFLETYNGGKPEANIVKITGCEIDEFLISRFFGTNPDENVDIVYQFNLLKKRIPRECMPIADVEGGNVLCINLSEKKTGYIYLWDHELELLHGEAITIDNMYFVAKSFSEFLRMIEPYNPQNEDLRGYKVISVKILDPEFYKKVKQEQGLE